MSNFNISCFLEKLILSIKNVDSVFFRIPTEYELDGISRERVFCYELYHQLRLVLSDQHPFYLHGELDKSGHSAFPRNLRGIPDFLFHIPGTHDGNMVIMEVKGMLDPNNIILDIKKINGFISHPKIHYQYGVFLIYNYAIEDLMSRRMHELFRIVPQKTDKKIYLISALKNKRIECVSLSLFREYLKNNFYQNFI